MLLGSCIIELWVWRVNGELRYRIVSKAYYWGDCVIEFYVGRVTGELRYRIVGEACYWGNALENCG